MLEHYKGDEVFVRRIIDYCEQVDHHQTMVLTKFLNPHEASMVEEIAHHYGISVHSFGGFKNCENVRMILCPDYYEITNDDFEIVVAEVIYNTTFNKLEHRDVLGALMNLGIERSCIGDIDDYEGLYFACMASSFPFIKENLIKIKRANVRLEVIDEVREIRYDYLIKEFVVSSFRIDKLISVLFNVPRNKVKSYISSGYVKVNHKQVAQTSYLCHNNDIISLRKHGRVRIVDMERKTRGDNFVISGYFYK